MIAEVYSWLKGRDRVRKNHFSRWHSRQRSGGRADFVVKAEVRPQTFAVGVLAARKGDRESFDLKVLDLLRKQAKMFDLDY